jgi:hypothetical protein
MHLASKLNLDICSPIHDSVGSQDMYWPSIFGESMCTNPLDSGGSTNLHLTTLHENDVNDPSSTFSSDVPDHHLRIEGGNTHDHFGKSPASAVHQLAALNVALYEYSAKLPSMVAAGMKSADTTDSDRRDARKAKLFAFDGLFRLTAEFIDVMRCLFPTECKSSDSLSSIDPEELGVRLSASSLVSYGQQISHSDQPYTRTKLEQPSRSFSLVDEATMFMVVSCHCRLAEIYMLIFQMMQACVEHSLVPRMEKNWVIVLPQLQMGSHVAPPVHVDVNTPLSSATSSIYMLMITVLSSQLWEQVAKIMGAEVDASSRYASASRGSMADIMWNTMTDRTVGITQNINNTQQLLQRYSSYQNGGI